MQRKIAEELKLDSETMALFDKQDEEDDFNSVDHGSRDVIRGVSQVIAQTLVNRKFMMLFLNGSDDEVDVNRFGISPQSWTEHHAVVWTFKRRSLTINIGRYDEIRTNLRHTNVFLDCSGSDLISSEFRALVREEAASIVFRHPLMRGINLTTGTDLTTMVMKCCMYELFLQHSFHNVTGFDWVAHAPNYWTCDGIIKGDGTRKIGDLLHQDIHWVGGASWLGTMFERLMGDPEVPFFVVKDDISLFKKRSYRWISITSKNIKLHEHMKAILKSATSLFVALEKWDNPQILPDGLFKHCRNLGVLVMSHCAFSFISPPFVQCHGLRFLGLDHCTNDNTREGENSTNWSCLQSLWLLDLRYTEWGNILSAEKLDILINLRELNIEGFLCWQLTNRLWGRLPYLQKVRIIKPSRKEETSSIDCHNLFMDKKLDVEILDLSGNRDMENLPVSLSMAKSLQMLVLDGCDGLENVVVPDELRSSLRSFSFDGYGPANHWASSFKLHLGTSSERKQPPDLDKRDLKTSKISLKGCMQLENLFIRGLPNLVELDLSGCPIKMLDLTTMVANVPMLKWLFLLGCENLRMISWASYDPMELSHLEVVCIDTRPERAHGFTRPSIAQHKRVSLQLHAILVDARLARSLYSLVHHYENQRGYEDIYFNIHVTSSIEYGEGVQLETTSKDMIKPSIEQPHIHLRRYGDDAFSKIGDTPLLIFPQPPTQQLDRHVQIRRGSHGLESEFAHYYGLGYLLTQRAESLHMHDALTSASMHTGIWRRLRWCRLERCPNLCTVFPPGAYACDTLQIIYASDLLRADFIWSKGSRWHPAFENLQHLHLRSCPRLQFVLPVWVSSFPSLETLHVIHCGALTHVFVLDEVYPKEILVHGVPFPKLTTIHLHDLPKLQQIMGEVKMIAPAIETIRIRGCFVLRRLPALRGREPGLKRPAIETEKDVWDALEWDGLAAGHHPDLFEPSVHSRYYRRSRLLRGTVLR
ncbi:unnamed protein product [Urochloa decumbens]|uniref:Disease resistance protein At4g27190-like leucine-rich repeats domain-containing protein n=1 Tax=Urochloa decumbens TaxID=240449 RepID=A0ABC9D6S3_9POAL